MLSCILILGTFFKKIYLLSTQYLLACTPAGLKNFQVFQKERDEQVKKRRFRDRRRETHRQSRDSEGSWERALEKVGAHGTL